MAPDGGSSVTLTQLSGLRQALRIAVTQPNRHAPREALATSDWSPRSSPTTTSRPEPRKSPPPLPACRPWRCRRPNGWCGTAWAHRLSSGWQRSRAPSSELSGHRRRAGGPARRHRTPHTRGSLADDHRPPRCSDDDAAVRTITLNRPEERNAIDIPMRVALARGDRAADRLPSVRVIVLTGAGTGVLLRRGHLHHASACPRTRPWTRRPGAARDPRHLEHHQTGAGGRRGGGLRRRAWPWPPPATGWWPARRAFATTFTNVGLAGDMGDLRVAAGAGRRRAGAPDAAAAGAFGRRKPCDRGLVDAVAEPGQALESARREARRNWPRAPSGLRGRSRRLLALAADAAPCSTARTRSTACKQSFSTPTTSPKASPPFRRNDGRSSAHGKGARVMTSVIDRGGQPAAPTTD